MIHWHDFVDDWNLDFDFDHHADVSQIPIQLFTKLLELKNIHNFDEAFLLQLQLPIV